MRERKKQGNSKREIGRGKVEEGERKRDKDRENIRELKVESYEEKSTRNRKDEVEVERVRHTWI